MQPKVHASINDTGRKLTTNIVDNVTNLQLVSLTPEVKSSHGFTLIVMMPAANCRRSQQHQCLSRQP
jgi:hypothetical protein